MRWLVIAAVALGACKRPVRSTGTCEGAVGRVALAGALNPLSAYHQDWNDSAAPTAVRLDCGGKLVFVAFLLKRLPATGVARWSLPSDDPRCAAGRPDAGTAICAADQGLHWKLSAPNARPLLSTGTFEAAVDENKVLKGEARLAFQDGTAATIRFALDDGDVGADDLQGVNVSLIPGRITFTDQR